MNDDIIMDLYGWLSLLAFAIAIAFMLVMGAYHIFVHIHSTRKLAKAQRAHDNAKQDFFRKHGY